MKNYEKAYKEALENAKGIINYYKEHNRGDEAAIEDLEQIFPELKESEDKKIKKELTKFLKNASGGFLDTTIRCKTFGKWATWLEKQGEQKAIMNIPTREVILSIWDLGNEWKELTNGSISTKYGTQRDYIQKHWHESEYYLREKQGEPADKVEPKFKVGDWIVNNEDGSIGQITDIIYDELGYGYNHTNGWLHFVFEKDFHLWTIEDAKDGDVLACNEEILLFKSYSVQGRISVYCWYNWKTNNFHSIGVDDASLTKRNKIYPATKEQRDTLFKKMKEAGYQWDAEKKELKLLISNGGDFESNNSKQKPTWSEGDERIVTALMEGFRYHQLFNPRFGEVPNAEIISWIKSLKERLS